MTTLSASGKSAAALPEVADRKSKIIIWGPFNGASTCNGCWEGTGLGHMEWEEGKEEKSPVLFLGPKDSGPQDSFPGVGLPILSVLDLHSLVQWNPLLHRRQSPGGALFFLARDLSLPAFNFWHSLFIWRGFSQWKQLPPFLWSHSFGQGCSKDISLMLSSSYSQAGSDIFSYRCTIKGTGCIYSRIYQNLLGSRRNWASG